VSFISEPFNSKGHIAFIFRSHVRIERLVQAIFAAGGQPYGMPSGGADAALLAGVNGEPLGAGAAAGTPQPGKNMCAKCALARGELPAINGVNYDSHTLAAIQHQAQLKPFETTC